MPRRPTTTRRTSRRWLLHTGLATAAALALPELPAGAADDKVKLQRSDQPRPRNTRSAGSAG